MAEAYGSAEQRSSRYRADQNAAAPKEQHMLPLTETQIAHRQQFRDFVLNEAQAWHRAHLTRLYALWEKWNTMYYNGSLTPPYILITPTESPKAYGDCATISAFGGRSQIRIRTSLLLGTHPHVRPGEEFAEGRQRLIDDILLHEQVHQYHHEITGSLEDSYHGHGPAFAAMCNQIGSALGLPPVRSMKKRGKEKDLPSCAQWPLNVRPEGYYLGAYKMTEPDPGEEPAEEPSDESNEEADDQANDDDMLIAVLQYAIDAIDAEETDQARAILLEMQKTLRREH